MIRIKIEEYLFKRKLYKYIRDYKDDPQFYLKDERYKNCDVPAKECIKDYLRIDEQEILSHRFYKYATEDIKLELKQQIYWYYINITLEAHTREISPWVLSSKEKTEERKREMIKLAEEIKGGPINMEKINALNLRTTDSMWGIMRHCDVEEDDIACLMTAGVMLSDWYKQNKDVLVEVDKKMRKEYVELVARGHRFICGHNAFYQANPLYNTIACPGSYKQKKAIENGHDWRRFGTMFKDTTRWRLYHKQPNWGTTEYFEDYLKKYNKQWQDVWTKRYRDPSVEKVEKHNDLAYDRKEIRYVLPFRPYEPPYLFWETLKIPEIRELAKMPTLEEWKEALEPYKKQVEIITGVKNPGYRKWDEQELIEQIGKVRDEKTKVPDEAWYILPVDAVIPKELTPALMENFEKQLAEELKALKDTQDPEEKNR